jgi:hypothetical protein
MNSQTVGFAVAALVLLPRLALAQAPDSTRDSVNAGSSSQRHGPGERDLHFQGGFGLSHDDDVDDALAHDVLATYRFHYLEAGLFGTGGTALGPSYLAYGVAVGPVVQSESGLRASLLAQLGGDSYSSIGCGLFCGSGGGASATLPYAGARASLSWVFPAGRRTHFELGMSGFYGRDLEQREVRYTTRDGLFNSGESDEQTTTLGGERVGGTLNAGLTVDL